jgi:hypothetical protein
MSSILKQAIFLGSLFILSIGSLWGQTRLGADKAAPIVATHLSTLSISPGTVYTLSEQETLSIIALSSSIGINAFELIDCAYRYLAPRNMRMVLTGASLRKAKSTYDLGGDRIDALLPVERMIRLEAGAVLSSGQQAMDVYLDSKYTSDIEIGTALYEARFGFGKLSSLTFSQPYGVQVKKFFFTGKLERIDLYEPSKIAIYADGISKPKKWVIQTIRSR